MYGRERLCLFFNNFNTRYIFFIKLMINQFCLLQDLLGIGVFFLLLKKLGGGGVTGTKQCIGS